VPLKLPPAIRAKLVARDLDFHAYQPTHLFREARRLSLVAEPGDPWCVTIYRRGSTSWQDDIVGRAIADTLTEAFEVAMGSGDLKGALGRLEAGIEALTAVLRA